MEWRIVVNREQDMSGTLDFSARELARYLKLIDPAVETARLYDAAGGTEGITLYVDESLHKKFSGHTDPKLDDSYEINIVNGKGFIKGSNGRSVLFGVYRMLRELGCRWVRPGRLGEKIPRYHLKNEEINIKILEGASYRHRGVCIEGACSFEHVQNMIDWLPKIGMNSYFNQFMVPYTFFERWYSHSGNPYLTPQKTTVETVKNMVKAHIAEIKKRGMLYHAAGHGWTCEPFGIEGNGWVAKKYDIPPKIQSFLAQVNGKRELWDGGIALNTNLCYSNPEVRQTMTDAIVSYCEEHPEVDYLHFWLADGVNNHCECDNCKKMLPSDFYVKMLNEVDRLLSMKNIPTRIVFLVYLDLLWEPQEEILFHQDRFTLMFAPITRTFSVPVCDALTQEAQDLPPYVRNKLCMPKDVGENVARLRRWQEMFKGDGFVYDYHLWLDHFLDPGGCKSSEILFKDMKNLDEFGLNGMMSCQVQRPFFPTGLGMSAMAAALWDKDTTFEKVKNEYFTSLFGKDSQKFQAYMERLSTLFDPPYLRGEKATVSSDSEKRFAKIPYVVNEILPLIFERLNGADDECEKLTYTSLMIHAQLCIYLSRVLTARARGDNREMKKACDVAVDYVNRVELQVKDIFDADRFIAALNEKILNIHE